MKDVIVSVLSTGTPRATDKSAVVEFWSEVTALPASDALLMTSLTSMIILAARIVRVTSSTAGNIASNLSRKAVALKELTSPAAVNVARTIGL